MACATLKRTLDWEAVNQRPTKRRRCDPFGQPLRSETFSQTNSSCHNTPSSSNKIVREPQPSPFAEHNASKISSDKMSEKIREEIKRLNKRKKWPSSAAIERMQDSESSGSEMGLDSPRRHDSPPSIVHNPEKALFTFKQVQLICERMLKELEDNLREMYDAALTLKQTEQYDAFVKFTYDQIQRRHEAASSYLS